jgi:pyruvate carboxylase
VVDQSLVTQSSQRRKADPSNPNHIAAGMPGMVVHVAVAVGDLVSKGQKLVMLEAMKMQTVVNAERDGRIAEVCAHPGAQVECGDLLIVLEG